MAPRNRLRLRRGNSRCRSDERAANLRGAGEIRGPCCCGPWVRSCGSSLVERDDLEHTRDRVVQIAHAQSHLGLLLTDQVATIDFYEEPSVQMPPPPSCCASHAPSSLRLTWWSLACSATRLTPRRVRGCRQHSGATSTCCAPWPGRRRAPRRVAQCSRCTSPCRRRHPITVAATRSAGTSSSSRRPATSRPLRPRGVSSPRAGDRRPPGRARLRTADAVLTSALNSTADTPVQAPHPRYKRL